MIRIRLVHGDRTVELSLDGPITVDEERPALDHAITAARNLWAVTVAAGGTPDEPPRLEAGGMGFTAELAPNLPDHTRAAPDIVPATPGDPAWTHERRARLRYLAFLGNAMRGGHADARPLNLIAIPGWRAPGPDTIWPIDSGGLRPFAQE